jgi:hypothetical protein
LDVLEHARGAGDQAWLRRNSLSRLSFLQPQAASATVAVATPPAGRYHAHGLVGMRYSGEVLHPNCGSFAWILTDAGERHHLCSLTHQTIIRCPTADGT